MSLKRALLATALVSAPLLASMGAASAQPVTGLYIGVGAGANWVNNPAKVDLNGDVQNGNFGLPTNTRVNNVGKLNFDLGWTGVASIGWGFGNGIRAEIEGNYRNNEVDSIRGFGIAPVGRVGGFQRTYGVMANVFYDFDFANFGLGQSIFQPYVGIGAGYAWTDWNNVRGQNTGNGLAIFSNDTNGQFAYQGIVGISAPIEAVPGLSLTAEYRYMGSLKPDIRGSVINPAGGKVSEGKYRFSEAQNHSAIIGVRYAFNAAPPPIVAPMAAPVAPTAARTYLVFFDWDRADLTDRARQIIAEAAQATTRVQVTRIEVSGHTDTSGTAQYNQGLSVRRAQNVAAELVRLGVPRAAITTQGFGFSRPLVATGPGVREPQNRRVEIVLR